MDHFLLRYVAKDLATEEGARLLRYVQRVAKKSFSKSTPRPTEQGSGAITIGCWEKRENGTFVRLSNRHDAWMWATGEVIHGKKENHKRIVLFGESTARGWSLNLEAADILQDILEQEGNAVEIINIAKVKLGLQELGELVQRVHHLDPDHIIVWAGCNWAEFLEEPLGPLLEAFEEGGLNGLQCAREKLILDLAEERILRPLGNLVSRGVGVTCVIPEFNLMDWVADATRFCPVLDQADGRRWLTLKRKTATALKNGDIEGAYASAKEMLEIDKGEHSLALQYLAECELLKKNQESARRYLEAARDVPLTSPQPRCPTYVQKFLRKRSLELDIAIVDLPEVLGNTAGNRLPGKDLFLDYVHLNLKGMGIAVGAIAKSISESLGFRCGAKRELKLSANKLPSNESLAVSSVLAAIHNGNWGCAKEGLLYHHLKQALELDCESLTIIFAFFRTRMRSQIPEWMSSSYETFREPTRDLLCGQFTARPPVLPLLESIRRILLENGDAAMIEEVERLWNERFEVGHQGRLGLLSPERVARTWEEAQFLLERGWFEVYRDLEKFPFICKQPLNLLLQGAYRTRGNDPVKVLLNGIEVTHFEPSLHWKLISFPLESAKLHSGENELSLIWEYGDEEIARARRQTLDSLELGERRMYYHSFGGLHGLQLVAI